MSLRIILGVLALFSFSLATQANTALESFTKPIEYHNAVISPNGEHIAVQRKADDGKQLVAIITTKDLKLVSHIPATTGASPFRPVWVNDKKLLVSFTEAFDGRENEFTNGELMTMDVNGKKKRKIVRPQVFVSDEYTEKRYNKLHGWAEFAHILPDEKDYIAIKFYEYGFTRIGKKPKLYKVHATRGKVKLIAEAPTYKADFTFTPTGELAYSVGIDPETIKTENKYVIHRFADGDWIKLGDLELECDELEVISAGQNANEIYVRAGYTDKPDKVYRYNVETDEKKLVFYHPEVDPWGFTRDRKTGELITAHFEDGYPNIHLINENHVISRWYPALFKVFEGKQVRITSSTDNGKLLVVHVSGANEPGQFHIFNTETKKLRYLFNAAPWIKPEQLAEVKPIKFQTRDDQTIHGYLTEPKVKGKLPLVVLPHGGPHGPRDWWSYNPFVQFLASKGYAVLQVNFRGSGGYGYGFEEAGKRHWGTTIQYDIIDGTKWAANQENIDENRICIVGGSFGGYSALMSPTIEPDLFKCAVGVVGVYDLNLMWTTADIKRRKTGKNYLMEAIGNNKEELDKYSPLYRVDKLKAPVLLVHGKKDWRVDFKHFEVMKAALEKRKHPLETLVFKKEGHGIANEENRIEYYKKVESFLGKYL